MASNTKELESVVTGVLKSKGFTKKGMNWYFATAECICLINLQKSQYGGQYYVNNAILVRSLDNDEYPKVEKCHINIRLEQLVPNKSEIKLALDLEDGSATSQQKDEVLAEAIERYSVPFLMGLSTLDKLKYAVQHDPLVTVRAILPLKRHLFPEQHVGLTE
jgi:hypothetical protein